MGSKKYTKIAIAVLHFLFIQNIFATESDSSFKVRSKKNRLQIIACPEPLHQVLKTDPTEFITITLGYGLPYPGSYIKSGKHFTSRQKEIQKILTGGRQAILIQPLPELLDQATFNELVSELKVNIFLKNAFSSQDLSDHHSGIVPVQNISHVKIRKTPTGLGHDLHYELITDYFECGNLQEYLANIEETKISFESAIQILKDSVSGLTYLHENDIAHRDIKLENILVSQQSTRLPEAGIIDFGSAISSAVTESHGLSCSQHGTLSYRPPEEIIFLIETEKTDIDDHLNSFKPAKNLNTMSMTALLQSAKRKDVWSMGVTFLRFFSKILGTDFKEIREIFPASSFDTSFAKEDCCLEKIIHLKNFINDLQVTDQTLLASAEDIDQMNQHLETLKIVLKRMLNIDVTRRISAQRAKSMIFTINNR